MESAAADGDEEDKLVLIAVVGPRGVGKSALVRALSPTSTSSSVAGVVPELRVKTAEGVRIHVRDTDDAQADEVLAWANVVLLVYRADRVGDAEAAVDAWMPRVALATPVLLIGTHIDARLRVVPQGPLSEDDMDALLERMEDAGAQQRIAPLLQRWPHAVGALEVSCTLKVNVGAAFSLACSAVLEPRSALIDADSRALTKEFKRALRRIFFLLDADGDGRLNSDEISAYQRRVFGLEGADADAALRATVAQLQRDGDWTLGGATYQGFEAAFRLMVTDGAAPAAWRALRHYGYTRRLELRLAGGDGDGDGGAEPNAHERLQYSAAAMAWLRAVHARLSRVSHTLALANVRALLSLLPDGVIGDAEWPMDDIVSGDVVPVSGTGLSVVSWLALWHLLLEPNTAAAARTATLAARVWGYEGTAFVVCVVRSAAAGPPARILVMGSGVRSRARVMRVVCGGARNLDDPLAERIALCAGRLSGSGDADHFVCAFAPKRLPADVSRFDLLVLPIDAADDERAFLRGASQALLCSGARVATLAVCDGADADAAPAVAREWCAARGVAIVGARDAQQLRRALADARTPLAPLPGDVVTRAPVVAAAVRRERPLWFVALVLCAALSGLLSVGWISRATGAPASLVTLIVSVVAAFAVARLAMNAI